MTAHTDHPYASPGPALSPLHHHPPLAVLLNDCLGDLAARSSFVLCASMFGEERSVESVEEFRERLTR